MRPTGGYRPIASEDEVGRADWEVSQPYHGHLRAREGVIRSADDSVPGEEELYENAG